MRDRQPVLSVFYGYTAEVVAEWCGVPVDVAQSWKAGEIAPSRPALRLFELHRGRKVLGSIAWDGWIIKGDVLVDPEGNEFSQGQLRAYQLIYQLCHELGRDTPGFWERLKGIQEVAIG